MAFSLDNIRVSLLICSASDNFIVLKRGLVTDHRKNIEDSTALVASVDSAQAFQFTVDQVVVDVLLSLAHLLQGSVELVHHLDVASLDGSRLFDAPLVELLKSA